MHYYIFHNETKSRRWSLLLFWRYPPMTSIPVGIILFILFRCFRKYCCNSSFSYFFCWQKHVRTFICGFRRKFFNDIRAIKINLKRNELRTLLDKLHGTWWNNLIKIQKKYNTRLVVPKYFLLSFVKIALWAIQSPKKLHRQDTEIASVVLN